jgi:CBS domain containing-hemolysin-like protein
VRRLAVVTLFGVQVSFYCSGVYAGIVLSHMAVCSLGTRVLARLQRLYILSNILYVFSSLFMYSQLSFRLCLVVIIALPAVTPTALKNTAKFALGELSNGMYMFSYLKPANTCCSQWLAKWICFHLELPYTLLDNWSVR